MFDHAPAFLNSGSPGIVTVRIKDGTGAVIAEGSGELAMIDAPVLYLRHRGGVTAA